MNLFVKRSHRKNIAYVYHEKKNLFALSVRTELVQKKERRSNNPRGKFKLKKVFIKKKN